MRIKRHNIKCILEGFIKYMEDLPTSDIESESAPQIKGNKWSGNDVLSMPLFRILISFSIHTRSRPDDVTCSLRQRSFIPP